jgi:hypothetical protein
VVEEQQRLLLRLRFLAVTSSVIVPTLVGLDVPQRFEPWFRIAAVVLGLVAALSVALLQLFRFGEKWRTYRSAARRLLSEGWYFVERADQYEGEDASVAFRRFVKRVEGILAEFEESYRNELQLLGEQPGTGVP